jgi:hypothetical protein
VHDLLVCHKFKVLRERSDFNLICFEKFYTLCRISILHYLETQIFIHREKIILSRFTFISALMRQEGSFTSASLPARPFRSAAKVA